MKRLLFLVLICLPGMTTRGATFSLSGYVKDMQGLYYLENPIPTGTGSTFQWSTFNQVHNRFNLTWTPTTKTRLEAGIRNRLLTGKLIHDIAGYAGIFEGDDGLVDLSWNLADQPDWFLNTSIDRFFLEYSLNQFQVRIGRQRINWGINLVWNPNDLFNAFSYVDFDYEERPGSDALLLTWYSSGTSNLDIVLKTDSSHSITLAGRYVFNLMDYDFQLIGGKHYDDVVLGGGFSGSIGMVSFRGEGSLFVPAFTRNTGSKTTLSATLSADYTTKNDIYLHGALLYNGMGTLDKGTSLSLLNQSGSLNARNLSMGKYEVFGQVSYPLEPLVQLSVSGMLNPLDGSVYVGPTTTISLHDNIELMLTAQLMLGDPGSEYGFAGNTYAGFGRLRWSF